MMTINLIPQREFTLATNDGLALYAHTWGDPQASRAAVVLVHGLGEHCGRYEHVAQALVSESLYVLGFDQRGHGRSPGKRGLIPSYDQPLDDIAVALERAQTNAPSLPVFLYGHSLGGLEVLHYGLARKPKLQGVIATSPALMISTSALNRIMATMMKHLAPNMIVANGLDASALSRDPLVGQAYLQAAVDDLFGVPRATGLAGATVPKLSGIRELYLSLTGDLELHGGYYAERVQLATTADFTGLVKNALNKLVANTWDELGRAGYDWWKYISVQEHFSTLHPITGTLVGTVGALPAVAEGGTYTELAVGDSPETANFIKYGGYIPLTLELIDRDETRKLRAYTRELASAGMRNISSLVSAIFTSNAGIGPTMADGGALFNATAVTTVGGHANLSTTALSSTSWDAVSANVYKQPMLIKNAAGLYGTGPQLAVNPKFLLVPRALQKTAREICEGNFVRESGYVYDNVLKGSAVPVTVPDWTDTNNWAAACDPLIAPAVFIGERFGLMPEIFVAGSEHAPAVFTNDEHRLKVRHFLAVWVNDYRPLYKCNVA